MQKHFQKVAHQFHSAALTEGPAELVFYNGVVYSADSAQSQFDAVAIKDGRIVYRGSDRGAKHWIGRHTEVVDLRGRMLLPGFHDAHMHPFLGAVDLRECSLVGLNSIDEYLARVQQRVDDHPAEEYIRGSGWQYASFPISGPHREGLDRIVPDRPVLLKAIDGHSAWVNSKALELAGIDRATPDPAGGKIERDPVTGDPSGTLREWNAIRLVEDEFPEWNTEKLVNAFELFQQMAVRSGLTAFHDSMASKEYLAAYLMLESQERLHLRVSMSLLCEPGQAEDGLKDLVELRQKCCGPLVTARSTKIFLDGVVEGHTAFLLEPYADRDAFTGAPLWEWEEYRRVVAVLEQEGFQVHVHAVGDGAVRMAMDGFEYAKRAGKRSNTRHQIAHLDLVSRQDIPRFKSLGLIANFQPLWFVDEAASMDLDVRLLGTERPQQFYPMQEIFDAGGTITCGSDWPVGTEFISLNPLDSIKAGLMGLANAEKKSHLRPIDIRTMLDFYTNAAAYAAFQEQFTGSIEIGKSADLIVLDRNLFEVPVNEIDDVKVLLTLLGGTTTFSDDAL